MFTLKVWNLSLLDNFRQLSDIVGWSISHFLPKKNAKYMAFIFAPAAAPTVSKKQIWKYKF